jgi:benzylsuccinate CoA-transferase BbsF subunit
VDNFGVDPLPGWGLSYDALREIRPDIIMARSSVMGRSGRHSGAVGFGYSIAAIAGWNALANGDATPIGTGPAIPDYSSNLHHLLVGILAALRQRGITGEGQYIDLSQFESTATWIAPALMDAAGNGVDPPATGNRSPVHAPHGVFPTAGDDRWIAIAVDDATWPAFAAEAGLDRARLAALDARKAEEDTLEAAVAAWTAPQDGHALMERLQAVGVAAHIVSDARDLIDDDPQLRHRGHFVRLEHPETGARLWDRHPFELSATPSENRRSRLLGEDNDWLLDELLGLDPEAAAALYVEGAVA